MFTTTKECFRGQLLDSVIVRSVEPIHCRSQYSLKILLRTFVLIRLYQMQPSDGQLLVPPYGQTPIQAISSASGIYYGLQECVGKSVCIFQSFL